MWHIVVAVNTRQASYVVTCILLGIIVLNVSICILSLCLLTSPVKPEGRARPQRRSQEGRRSQESLEPTRWSTSSRRSTTSFGEPHVPLSGTKCGIYLSDMGGDPLVGRPATKDCCTECRAGSKAASSLAADAATAVSSPVAAGSGATGRAAKESSCHLRQELMVLPASGGETAAVAAVRPAADGRASWLPGARGEVLSQRPRWSEE
eukprot:CAMPEP_0179089530 /NCGR_PEP_ID=MMETSP0796-20121207/40799_1 /TAXON_ID=73915 /ORGANISM="Pyrodinium bahamense, Strain pbaha01" /LENGTH=206 /DNA_ID=CAMNT_0020787087 /DNA_START=309 /DNA_END=929 /DNA_ORIENTATION=+